MEFHIMTLFPEMVEQGLKNSITGRALEQGVIALNAVDIRHYAANKHKKVDDYPYGGGAGMLMQAQPIMDCYRGLLESGLKKKKHRVIYLTPQGHLFHQEMARELAGEEALVFLCGHYEGVDERVLDAIVTDRISIGDYVLTGGELAAMVMTDCISRLVPGVLGNEISASTESFDDGLLEYPQYTRPETFEGRQVPEVLLSGHHEKIDRWRREQSLLRTKIFRPDLLHKADLTAEDVRFLNKLEEMQDNDRKTEITDLNDKK